MTIRKRFFAFAAGFFALCMLVASCAQPSGSGTSSGGGSSGGGGSSSGGGGDVDPAIYEELAGLYEGDEFDYMFEIDETGMGGTGFVIEHDDSSLSIRAANAGPSSGQSFTWKVIRVRGDEVDVEITVDGEQPVKAVFNTKDNTVTIDGKRYEVKNVPEGELKAAPSVGSIIMKDGSLKTTGNISEADKSNAIAIVYKVDTVNKKAWAVGKVQNKVQNKGNGVWWSAPSASGNKYVKGLDTTINGRSFSGYTDGRTGIATLRAAVKDYWEWNYQAWVWCQNYGTKQAGLTGDLAKGWYFPTVKELYDIYQAKSAVETALEASGGSKFGGTEYWSSSQDNDMAYVFNFDTGSFYRRTKYQQRWVCAARVFTYD